VPVYTIAKGAGIQDQTLQQLAAVSRSTGGMAITLEGSSEIQPAFEKIFQDVMHGYLLAFQAPDSPGHVWHTIEVVLKSANGRKVRARDGYYPE
jgi:glucose-6-phosphate 1-dehydrogenase